jgi:hypothetical protein
MTEAFLRLLNNDRFFKMTSFSDFSKFINFVPAIQTGGYRLLCRDEFISYKNGTHVL